MDDSGSTNESQFEARESDGETLWEVIEITAEKNKLFRVRWAGVDPKTQKPYAQSWVHRRDVTDDLVYEWKRKKALKKNRANTKSIGGSAVSRVSNSSSKPAQINWESPPKASSSKPGKRRSSAEDDRPSKRQRLSSVDPRAPAARKTSKTVTLDQEEDSDTPSTLASKSKQKESVGDDRPQPTKPKPKPFAEPEEEDSQRSSAPQKRPDKGKAKQLPIADEDDTPSPPEVKRKQKAKTPLFLEEDSVGDDDLPQPTKSKRKLFVEPEEEDSQRSSAPQKRPDKGKAKQLPIADEDDTPSLPEVKQKQKAKTPYFTEEEEEPLAMLRKPAKGKAKPRLYSEESPPPTAKAKQRVKGASLPKVSKAVAHASRTKYKSKLRKQTTPARQSPSIVTESQVFRRMSPGTAKQLQQFDEDVATQQMQTPPSVSRPLTPVLSPAAKERLQEFDDALLQIEAENRKFYPPSPERVSRADYHMPHLSEAELVSQPASPLPSPPRDDPYDFSLAGSPPPNPSPAGSPPPPDVDAEPLRTPERRSRASTTAHSRPASPRAHNIPPPDSPSSSIVIRRRPRSTIFVEETIVPETDSSHTQSQSQEAKKSSPPKEDKPRSKSSPVVLNGNTRIDFTNLVSWKKSKSEKPLGPIPRISPRVFYPYLKSHEAPPPSSGDSIETFSPEKAPQSSLINRLTSSVDEDEDARLRRLQEGKEMAEKAMRERRLREKGEPQPKRTLEEILAQGKQEARRRQQEKEKEQEPKRTLEEILAQGRQEARRRQQEKEKEQVVILGANVEDSEPRELVPATQESADLCVKEDTRTDEGDESGAKAGPVQFIPTEPVELVPATQESADLPVGEDTRTDEGDESGAKAGPRPAVQLIPMEEEETTQDVRDEMARFHEEDKRDQMTRFLEEQNKRDQMEWEATDNQPPDNSLEDPDLGDLGYPPDPHDEDKAAVAASRSPSPAFGVAETSQIPPTASFPPDPPSLSQIQIDSPEEVKVAYDRALVLLNQKSEEIKRLEEDLSQQRSENDKLTVQIRDFGQKLAGADAPSQPSSRYTESIINTLLRRQLEGERVAHQQVTQALEAADAYVAAASKSLQAANTAKVSAEKDRDFFREQYAQASAYVSTVRDENRDLEKRIEISERQTRDGVEMVRKTFETRVKDLEKDAKMWRNMANFLMEKDKRTDDEVRKRAALEPELQIRCRKLEGAIEVRDVSIEQLENDLEKIRQEKETLEEEVEKWKSEVARLNEGNELVYRCEWRVDGSVCPNAFDTIQELEQHMFNAGHLARLSD